MNDEAYAMVGYHMGRPAVLGEHAAHDGPGSVASDASKLEARPSLLHERLNYCAVDHRAWKIN
jgi:hypothetical protein